MINLRSLLLTLSISYFTCLAGCGSSIHRKQLPANVFPEKLQIYTEQYPPVSFRDDQGRITGGATEMVRNILARLNTPDNITLTDWANAYDIALHTPRVVLFSADRTANREELFNWVGPIGNNSAHFYTKSGSGITIDSIESAKAARAIGTCSSWFTEQALRDLGFTNLVSASEPKKLVQMLMSGEIEATVLTDITMNDIVHAAGFQMPQFKKQYLLSSTDFYIAISKGTEPEIVSAWRSALDDMIADGTFEAISKKWYSSAGR